MIGLYDDLRRRWVSAKQATGLAELVRSLQTGTADERVAAAQTLGTLRDQRGIPALREAAEAREPALRYAALLSLATLGEKAALVKAAKAEQDKDTRDRLIQVNYLLTAAEPELLRAIGSSDAQEVRRGIEAAAIRRVPATVPHLARIALTHLDTEMRQAAAAALAVADNALAYWTVRVASSHDASPKLRRTMWGLAVLADGGKS
jgi:HEAT repeat protein